MPRTAAEAPRRQPPSRGRPQRHRDTDTNQPTPKRPQGTPTPDPANTQSGHTAGRHKAHKGPRGAGGFLSLCVGLCVGERQKHPHRGEKGAGGRPGGGAGAETRTAPPAGTKDLTPVNCLPLNEDRESKRCTFTLVIPYEGGTSLTQNYRLAWLTTASNPQNTCRTSPTAPLYPRNHQQQTLFYLLPNRVEPPWHFHPDP